MIATTIKEWMIPGGIITTIIFGSIHVGAIKENVKYNTTEIVEVKEEVKEKRYVDLEQTIQLKEVAIQTKYLAEVVKELKK